MSEWSAERDAQLEKAGALEVDARQFEALEQAVVTDLLLELADYAIRTPGRLDLSDRDDLDPHTIAAVRDTASRMRGACDAVSRALAELWVDRWGEGWMRTSDGRHVTVGRGSGPWRIADREAFAQWLRAQDADTIAQVVSGVRVGPLGQAERDTFLEQSPGSLSITLTSVDSLRPGARRFSESLPDDVPVAAEDRVA